MRIVQSCRLFADVRFKILVTLYLMMYKVKCCYAVESPVQAHPPRRGSLRLRLATRSAHVEEVSRSDGPSSNAGEEIQTRDSQRSRRCTYTYMYSSVRAGVCTPCCTMLHNTVRFDAPRAHVYLCALHRTRGTFNSLMLTWTLCYVFLYTHRSYVQFKFFNTF